MANIKWNSRDRAIAITAIKEWQKDDMPADVDNWANKFLVVKYKDKEIDDMTEAEAKAALKELSKYK